MTTHELNKGVKKQLRVEFLSYPKSTNVKWKKGKNMMKKLEEEKEGRE